MNIMKRLLSTGLVAIPLGPATPIQTQLQNSTVLGAGVFTSNTGDPRIRGVSVLGSNEEPSTSSAALLSSSRGQTQSSQSVSIPPDSPSWELQGQARATEYQGRKCLYVDGGAAVLQDLEMRDGVIDVDVATTAKRGFFGIDFRLADNGANGERIYLRPHRSGYPDAMQYTPVLGTGANWQIYNGPGFTGAIDIPKDTWFHMRLEVSGAQAKLYVKDMDRPALVMDDLKSGVQKGRVALYVLTGATYYSNFEVREMPAAPWERHCPPMPRDTLTRWSLSPSYDALSRKLERPLSPAERDAVEWQDVEAEPPGFVVLYRYRRPRI